MIEYIKGDIVELTPTQMIIECAGIGYELNISLTTYSAFSGKPTGKIYVYEVIREDAHLLFGFAQKVERELFLLGRNRDKAESIRKAEYIRPGKPARAADCPYRTKSRIWRKACPGTGRRPELRRRPFEFRIVCPCRTEQQQAADRGRQPQGEKVFCGIFRGFCYHHAG